MWLRAEEPLSSALAPQLPQRTAEEPFVCVCVNSSDQICALSGLKHTTNNMDHFKWQYRQKLFGTSYMQKCTVIPILSTVYEQ